MAFTAELREFVQHHGAINNPYLDRFQTGNLTDEEVYHFAEQFFAFVKHFPRILAALLANAADDAEAEELVGILASELGDGNPKQRHEYIYHRFLRSIGIDPHEAARASWFDSTNEYIEGLAALYGNRDHQIALGASFGLEHMAVSMWDQLIPGLQALKNTRPALAKMDTAYWTFHRSLEEKHEEAMMKALDGTPKNNEKALRQGCGQALDLLEGFWMGLHNYCLPEVQTA